MIRIDCRGVSTESPASSEQVRAAADCFVKYGYAILDHVVPAAKIQAPMKNDSALVFQRVAG